MRCPTVVLLLALCTNWTHAGDPLPSTPEPTPHGPAPSSTVVMPELESADMRLSWADFRELLQLLQPAADGAHAKPDAPPWPWTLSAARYELDATNAPEISLTAAYDIRVWNESWCTIPILGKDVALGSALLDGEPAQLGEEDGFFTLLIDEPGQHQLNLAFYAKTVEKDGDVTLEIPVAPATITEARLLLGTDAAAVSSPDAARVETQIHEGQEVSILALRPSETLRLHWRRPSLAKAPAPPEPPRIAAEFTSQVRLSPTLLEGSTEVRFDLLRGTADRFDLEIPPGVVVLDVTGTGMEWSVTTESDNQHLNVALNHQATDQYTLKIRYELPMDEDATTTEIPRFIAQGMARQTGVIGVSALRNTNIDITEPTAGVSRIDADGQFDLGLDWEVLHAFRYIQPDYALAVAASIIEPHIVAETEILAGLSNVALRAQVTVRYRVLRGETKRFSIELPQDVNVLAVSAPAMDWYGIEDGEIRRVEMELNEVATDTYTVELALERDLVPGDDLVPIPPVSARDVARQTGWVGVEADGNVKIDLGEGVTGLTRIDETELPRTVRDRAQSPILHAFEFQSAPFTLPVTVTRLDDVAVRVAAVDSVELDTVVADDMIITRARYWVRNNQQQFLRIDPGPGTEIWGAHVDGHAASPAKDPASETGVLLRMRKSREGVGGLGSFPMELIYMQRPAAGRLGQRSFSLVAPETDILADRMDWTVFIPEDEHLASWTGDLKPGLAAGPVTSPDRGVMTIGSPETIHRLREGVERFLVTDINNPAGSAQAQSKTFSDRQYANAGTEDTSARMAGILPVHINLPQSGVPHRFERTLVAQGEQPHLKITLRAVPLERFWLFLCGASAALLLALRGVRGVLPIPSIRPAAIRYAAAGILVVLAVALLQARGEGVVVALIGLALALLVLQGRKWYRHLEKRPRPESST